jgi:hypothetical protein
LTLTDFLALYFTLLFCCSLALALLFITEKLQKKQKKTEIACLRQAPSATLTLTLTLTLNLET